MSGSANSAFGASIGSKPEYNPFQDTSDKCHWSPASFSVFFLKLQFFFFDFSSQLYLLFFWKKIVRIIDSSEYKQKRFSCLRENLDYTGINKLALLRKQKKQSNWNIFSTRCCTHISILLLVIICVLLYIQRRHFQS